MCAPIEQPTMPYNFTVSYHLCIDTLFYSLSDLWRSETPWHSTPENLSLISIHFADIQYHFLDTLLCHQVNNHQHLSIRPIFPSCQLRMALKAQRWLICGPLRLLQQGMNKQIVPLVAYPLVLGISARWNGSRIILKVQRRSLSYIIIAFRRSRSRFAHSLYLTRYLNSYLFSRSGKINRRLPPNWRDHTRFQTLGCSSGVID